MSQPSRRPRREQDDRISGIVPVSEAPVRGVTRVFDVSSMADDPAAQVAALLEARGDVAFEEESEVELLRSIFEEGPDLHVLMGRFVRAADHADPLVAEIAASFLLGNARAPIPLEYEQVIESELVARSLVMSWPWRMTMLRGISSVAESQHLRWTARDHAAVLATQGVLDVAWAGQLGQLRAGPCALIREVDDAWSVLVAGAAYGSSVHTLVVNLDRTFKGQPYTGGMSVRGDLERATAAVLSQHEGSKTEVRPLEPAAAYRMLRDTIRATDKLGRLYNSAGFEQLRLLALARCRELLKK